MKARKSRFLVAREIREPKGGAALLGMTATTNARTRAEVPVPRMPGWSRFDQLSTRGYVKGKSRNRTHM